MSVLMACTTMVDTVADFLSVAGKWRAPINAAEALHGIPTNLLVRIAYQESHFRESIINGTVKSSAGAVGIMQLMPKFFPGAGLNPIADIATAAGLLADLFKTFKDWQVAVAAYNWGEGDVEHSYLKDVDHYLLSTMPVETQNYVTEVFSDVPVTGILLAQAAIPMHTPPTTIEDTTLNTTTVGALPWYKSPVQVAQVATFLSAAIALFPKLGTLLGLTTPEQVANFVQTAFGAITLIAPIVGTILRAKSKIQPLTLSQTAADNHPATAMAKSEGTEAATVQTPTQVSPAPPASSAPPPPGKPWGK
jgi:hypothetical protein